VLLLLAVAIASFGYASEVPVEAEDEVDVELEEEKNNGLGPFTEEERAAMTGHEETHEFQAEVNRLMDIIINSLYSNRDIFLRELISNAADALDKIRYTGLTNKEALGEGDIADLDIRISYDTAARTLTITDKGVGMTKEELIRNLGTVAKSGTTDFAEAAGAAATSEDSALSLIGQFGVGFYSVYLVADTVTVVSKNNDDASQWVWESQADRTYTVVEDPRGNTLGRGTSVTLHLKEDADSYMSEAELTKLVGRYSEFINFPIYLDSVTTVTREEPIEEEETEDVAGDEDTEATGEEDDDDMIAGDDEDGEDEKPKTRTVTEEVQEWKLLNDQKAIWTRPASDITDEEYDSFYKSLSKDYAAPLSKIHFTAEGEITFRSILYIPAHAPQGLYDRFYDKSTSLKLYVRRVLISDEFEDFLPRYMNFVRGVVDSEDLPLNVSRETLAQSRVLKVMGKKLTRKVLEMLRKLAAESEEELDEDEEPEVDEDGEVIEKEEKEEKENKYLTFWKEFGKSIKLGVVDDRTNKAKLTKLLRYETSTSDGELISLEDYVENMKEDQEHIYYITGESMEAVKKSPFLERLSSKGYEVIYMVDPLDEYVVQTLTEFDGNSLQSVTKEGLKLGDEARFEALKEEYEDFSKWLAEIYGDKVEKVVVSSRLADSPCVLVTGQYGWSANMERIMKAQTFNDPSKQQYMISKKTMEINPRHPIVKELREQSETFPDDEAVRDLAELMYDAALVQSGFTLDDSSNFAERIHRVVASGLNVDPNAKVDAEPEMPEEEEEEVQEEEDVEIELDSEVEDEIEEDVQEDVEEDVQEDVEEPEHEEL